MASNSTINAQTLRRPNDDEVRFCIIGYRVNVEMGLGAEDLRISPL